MASDRRTQQIRKWLLQSPRPAAVRVVTADDETHDFGIASNVRWATLAASVAALDPVMIQALSQSGGIERAVKVADWEPDAVEPARTGLEVQPPLPDYAHDDPETARFALVARLLADAHKFSTGVAFDRMVDIVKLLTNRMDALEAKADRSDKRYQEEVYARIQDMLDDAAAAGEEEDAGGILSTFASAIEAGRRGDAPNGKPNGKPRGGRPRSRRAQA